MRIELKKHVPMWADEVALKKEISLPTAEVYAIDFADYAREFAKDLEQGQEYFVKWGFTRIATVSKDNYNEGGDTYRARFQGKSGAPSAKKGGWPTLGSVPGFGR